MGSPAIQENVKSIGCLKAGSDLSSAQFKCVTISGAFAVGLPSAGGRVLGILTNKPTSGQAAVISIDGVEKVELGDTVSAGDALMSNAAGEAVPATGTNVVFAIALQDGVDGDRISVLLGHPGEAVNVLGIETVTSGALSLNYPISHLSVTGTQAFSLADGTVVGQRKRIECTVAASTPVGTLTINDAATGEPTSWVFNNVGQMLDLVWTATGWKILALRAAGTDTPAGATTLNLLVLHHRITIADTLDWIIPDGEVAGQEQMITVAAVSGTPAGTISGLWYDDDGTADGTDVNLNAAGDAVLAKWDGSRWIALNLVSATVS